MPLQVIPTTICNHDMQAGPGHRQTTGTRRGRNVFQIIDTACFADHRRMLGFPATLLACPLMHHAVFQTSVRLLSIIIIKKKYHHFTQNVSSGPIIFFSFFFSRYPHSRFSSPSVFFLRSLDSTGQLRSLRPFHVSPPSNPSTASSPIHFVFPARFNHPSPGQNSRALLIIINRGLVSQLL